MGRDEETGPVTNCSNFRYNSPLVQVTLIGLVCFCCPGMFNAMSGMGNDGQKDPTLAGNADTVFYTMFAVSGVVGGGLYNILGPRTTLFVGCSTYILYAGSFLYDNHHQSEGLTLAAGGLQGVGAGLLWAGHGAIMTSYPTPNRKGTYISLFWVIFNMGSVTGGLIPFVLNYRRPESAATANDATYIGFIVFMTIGTFLSLAILHPSRVIRDDGSACTNIKYSSNIKLESVEIVKLFFDWKMMLIFPAAWASNFFYSYQFNSVNADMFDLRTRGLNNTLYWVAQMIGSVIIGYVMDFSFENRRVRGLVGIGIVGLLGTGTWAIGLVNQLGYSRTHEPSKRLDFKDSGSDYAQPVVLYLSYGLLDAMFQSMVYWVIGALADDSETLSRYVGFYKGIQSAGAAVDCQLDAQKVAYLTQLIVDWSLTTLSYPILAVLVIVAVKENNSVQEEITPPITSTDFSSHPAARQATHLENSFSSL